MVSDDATRFACDLRALTRLDAATLDGLARLQLAARRGGRDLRLRHVSDEMHSLLALLGMCDVVGVCPDLGLEPGGEAEERKHPRRVEEEGDAADTIA